MLQATERGRTGQSLGQRLAGVVMVGQKTGVPIGLVRSILSAFAGQVRPVVHRQRQARADSTTRTAEVQPALNEAVAR
ncbi:hypothetical protein ACFYNO_40765 [Kitasatospora sp. NPDC006697]|uniref:hypothetical protein n=1 Tax=Kitasatospora sp. NPDC006697 TaxID=3364020 RepID=UPI0036B519D6